MQQYETLKTTAKMLAYQSAFGVLEGNLVIFYLHTA